MPSSPSIRQALLLAVAGLLTVSHACVIGAPNAVPINSTLLTSGQPSAIELSRLGEQGVQAVIYLAPATVSDAVKNEPDLLNKQGIEFVHIPIPFDAPLESHYEAVATALERLKDKKVLVHCQVNMRASTMVFLYRAIRLSEEPAQAYEAVSKVWKPEGAWKRLISTVLAKHNIAFVPY